MTTRQPEALRREYRASMPPEVLHMWAADALACIASLEAQLEAIGAGGVSALMGAANAGSEPMFWVRLLRDGLYEGPVHHKSIGGKMLRDEKPGEWTPLYTHPSPPEGMVGWRSVPVELVKEAIEAINDYRSCLEFEKHDRRVLGMLKAVLQPLPASEAKDQA